MVKRQRFTAEFKREAVRLLDAGERPASELAIDLGIVTSSTSGRPSWLARVKRRSKVPGARPTRTRRSYD